MKKKYNQVYQFKITLCGIRPPIWRRIQVPETYSFWDLHVAIQDAMGWWDSHLHLFEIFNPRSGSKNEIGIPAKDLGYDNETLAGWKYYIADYFNMENKSCNYFYDFGDDWQHIILLEKIIPCENGIKYPTCIKGKRACPPEDCGGVWGYMDLLEILNDPEHDEYEDMLEWAGGKIDPERFNPKEVHFDNPTTRRKNSMLF
ncbi:plasmid pRiA4b ORF-3 family protein [bacterium]|nr:plasmid pRiA4b ORF-3 family protein [bacterium]